MVLFASGRLEFELVPCVVGGNPVESVGGPTSLNRAWFCVSGRGSMGFGADGIGSSEGSGEISQIERRYLRCAGGNGGNGLLLTPPFKNGIGSSEGSGETSQTERRYLR